MTTLPQMEQLRTIMQKLRDKEHGCPWDLEQTFHSIAPYTIEEAYEVVEAIEQNDMDELKQELGDLLLQVVFHAQIAEEEGHFTLEDIAQAISDKMVRRHPHVFGDAPAPSLEEYRAHWETLKAEERKDKPALESVLDDVPHALPSLMRAEKIQKRVARVGFDWKEIEPVFAKVDEELDEIRDALANHPDKVSEEIGDLLFCCANLARHCHTDPEHALRDANRKFERRFRSIEQALKAQKRTPEDASLDEMEALWQQAKQQEKAA